MGYPGNEEFEEEYWVENFDWSQIQKLQMRKVGMALDLTSKLTALRNIVFDSKSGPKAYGRHISELFMNVLTSLESITVPHVGFPTVAGILRHGTSLRKLRLHQFENGGAGDLSWKTAAIDTDSLSQVQKHCPNIEEMCLDIVRSGKWPWEMFDVISSFPRLKRLTIWFALGAWHPGAQDPVTPYTTFDASGVIFKCLRDSSTRQPSPLSWLRIYSGAHVPRG